MEPTADIALIGLAVMGQNLILNMNDHGFTVVAYNRTVSKVDEFLNDQAKGRKTILGAHSIEEMVGLLKRPRKIMLMVKAGKAVDDFIEQILPYLEPGDLIIDGGNSHFPDTIRRTKYLESKGLLYIGTGVSGGEEGARFGPAIMPGGSPQAWPLVKDIFQAIAAKTPSGEPCCDWIGEDGAGHYVKMIHNGIEYGDMQLICEAYQLMKEGLGMSNEEMHAVFAEWNKGELDSYLIEITRDILGYKDEKGEYVVDKILDTAGQKGTGKWTAVSSLDLGMPVTLIGEAVFARCLSAMKDERVEASKVLTGPKTRLEGDKKQLVEDIRRGAARLQDRLLRAGLHAHERSREGVQVEPELRRHRADLARRLHHPLRVPWQDQGSLRPQARAQQPAAGPVLQGRHRQLPGRPGGGWSRRPSQSGVPGPGLHHRARLLRRLSQRAAARQPAAGPARLLRRAHLRARRPAPRRVLPHQLDRPRRHGFRRHLHGLIESVGRPSPAPYLTPMPDAVIELAAKTKLLLMDVDGVLTDGKLYNLPDASGKMVETKAFDSQDGISLHWLNWKGIKTGLISGRNSPATVERATQCKFTYVYQGHIEKIPILNEILADAGLDPSQVAYIGDDLTDVVVMHRVGFAIATANARPEVKQQAHFVTANPGGQGAVREVAELLLKAQGYWQEILRKYEICGA